MSLNEDEVYIHGTKNEYEGKSLSIMNESFLVKGTMEDMKVFQGGAVANIYDFYYIIVNNVDILQRLEQQQKSILGQYAGSIQTSVGIDLKEGTGEEQEEAFGAILESELKAANVKVDFFESRTAAADDFRALRAGVLFLGIHLGIVLLMATVLIIYYKQISEAYDDKDRYGIMQKVGLSLQEIKKSIRSQILIVFFLPLVVAGVHVAVIFALMERLMVLLLLNHVNMFLICIMVSYAFFVIVYAMIYAITARTYYKIVSA